ncbi:MAG: glycoside hydrolase family 3 C-terminal domain-containing protein [Bacteroidales bacterium]|nr:glycoside hydrolase family 3 C-terminal domain-containing protein [Bacteroidales bacterium]
MRNLFIVLVAVACLCGCDRRSEAERFADDLMSRMTLREKVGQMSQFAPQTGVVTGPEGEPMDLNALIKAGEVGSVLNVKTPEEIWELQRLAVDSSRLGIPILFGHDIIHGCKVIFPINLGSACSWNVEAVKESARIAAAEAAAMGIAWTFSPMCDVSADPRWGRVSEGSGEDPYLAAKLSAAMVEGYQGEELADSTTIMACVKHFAAYGAPEAGRDYNTVDMSERMFRDRYLPPYVAALDAGAATVMTSFNDFNAIPASGSRWLLKELLRDELGFDGFVVSDYRAVTEMIAHGVARDTTEAAYKAMKACLDMEMVSGSYLNSVEELVKEGLVSEKEIDAMCRNVLVAKYNLGLFEDPFRYGGAERFAGSIYRPEDLAFARSIARESMVLLKNEGEVLPLDGGERIALIGPYISSPRAMLGSWTAFRDYDRTVTIGQGFEERFPGKVTMTAGCGPYAEIDGGIAQAVRAARNADVAVLTLGLPGEFSGEAASMTSVELPQAQKNLLAAVKAAGKPVVVLLTTGRPMALESVIDDMDALFLAWHPGTEGGHAIADVISGDHSPSGHLVMSFPRCDGQIPIRYNHKATGRPLEGTAPDPLISMKKLYKSCYLFTPDTPLYPFGYGLSYTEFEFDSLEVVDKDNIHIGDDVTVRVRVSNVGDRDGATVAQLYMRDMAASTTRPVRELKGFERLHLRKGELRVVEFVLTAEDMSFWREDMKFGQEPGEFRLWLGNHSDATLEASFTVRP